MGYGWRVCYARKLLHISRYKDTKFNPRCQVFRGKFFNFSPTASPRKLQITRLQGCVACNACNAVTNPFGEYADRGWEGERNVKPCISIGFADATTAAATSTDTTYTPKLQITRLQGRVASNGCKVKGESYSVVLVATQPNGG